MGKNRDRGCRLLLWLPMVQLRKLIRGGCKEFAKFTKFEIGNGVWVQFWHNARYADEPLKILCPELFQIGLLKE